MSAIREIIGNTTTTPVPQSDWNQTDSTKADYIKNKPITSKHFDLSSVDLVDGYVVGSNGSILQSSTPYHSTDLIDISAFGGGVLSITSYINGNCGFALYDKDKIYLCGANGNTGEFTPNAKTPQTVEWNIPDDAYYVRFTLMANGVISDYPMSVQITNLVQTMETIANEAKTIANEVNTIANEVDNLVHINLDLSTIELADGYVVGSDGMVLTSSIYKTTDLIDISAFGGGVLSITSYINGNCGFALYDKDKVYLCGASGNTGEFTPNAKTPQTVEWNIPDDAYYVRFTLMANGVISDYPMSATITNLIQTINGIVDSKLNVGDGDEDGGVGEGNGNTRSIDLSDVKTTGAYIMGSDGMALASTTYLATDFIPIVGTEGATITFTSLLIGNVGFAFYDKNEQFIHGLNGNSEGITGSAKAGQTVTCIVPEGTYYVRFTMKSTENTSAYPMRVEYKDLATFAASISKEVEADITTRMKTFCLVNPAAKAYMDEVTYPDDDYSYSCMYSNPVVEGRNYGATQLYRTDRPLPVFIKWPKDDYAVGVNILLTTSYNMPYGGDKSVHYHVPFGVDRFPIYNLLPNTEYWYKVTALYADGTEKVLIEKDSLKTTADQLRMIYADGCDNIRDLGGWNTYDASGNKTGTVKYERLYRGAALDGEYYYDAHISSAGASELTKYVGIQAELDLRGGHARASSPIAEDLKTDDDYLSVAYQSCVSLFTDTGKSATKAAFEFILAKLNESNAQKSRFKTKPVYYHCLGGADRTGTLTYLLLGVLGVSESDLTKDYELTSFSVQGIRARHIDTYGFPAFVSQLKTYSGNTMQAKIENFLLECGISATDIEAFKTAMIKTV